MNEEKKNKNNNVFTGFNRDFGFIVGTTAICTDFAVAIVDVVAVNIDVVVAVEEVEVLAVDATAVFKVDVGIVAEDETEVVFVVGSTGNVNVIALSKGSVVVAVVVDASVSTGCDESAIVASFDDSPTKTKAIDTWISTQQQKDRYFTG